MSSPLKLVYDGERRPAPLADQHEALARYRRSADTDVAACLFDSARALRERHLGQRPWLTAKLAIAAPCLLRRPCIHCPKPPRSAATPDEIVDAAHALVANGYHRLRLVGGTRLPRTGEPSGGHDALIIRHVLALRAAVDVNVDIEVDVGPSLTRDGVRTLKQLGVAAIACSLDVLNPVVFERCKPDDSLRERLRLLETCEREGMPFRSTIRLGLGETDEDRIGHLFFLHRFPMLRHLDLARQPAAPGLAGNGCGPWPLARLIAVARHIFPALDIGLASGSDADDTPLWWLAGGGNEAIGATVTLPQRRTRKGLTESIAIGKRLALHDRTAALRQHFNDLGLALSTDRDLHALCSKPQGFRS